MAIRDFEVFLLTKGICDIPEGDHSEFPAFDVSPEYLIDGIYYTRNMALKKYEERRREVAAAGRDARVYYVLWGFHTCKDFDTTTDETYMVDETLDSKLLYKALQRAQGVDDAIVIKSTLWYGERTK